MEKIKTILDRKQLSSEYIRSKQDFAHVVKAAKGLGKPYWQTNWFYGTVGVATVAIIVTAVTLSSSDAPENKPEKNPVVAMSASNNHEENSILHDAKTANIEEVETKEASAAETVVKTDAAPSENLENSSAAARNVTPEEDHLETQAAREVPVEEVVVKRAEIGLPNVSGITGGPIAFRDFCNPLGIQVDGGVLIHEYTIQYRSCARDITARVRGNKLPEQVCQEIRDCGAPIEVTFSNFRAEDREGNKVQLKEFSLTTRP